MNRLFCFGLGFAAQTLAERLAAKEWQIAGTAREMKTSADFFAEQAYQILLARVQSAARLQSRLGNAFRLHLTQPAQTRRADRNRQQTFFNEHRRVRLVESVDRGQEDVHVSAVNLA